MYEHNACNTIHCCISISQQCVEWPSNGFVRLMETRWARERDLFIRCFCHVFAKAKISSECFTIISTHSIHIIYNDMNDFEQVQYFPISLAFQIVYYFSYTLTLTLGLHSMSVITLHIHPWFRWNPNILKHTNMLIAHSCMLCSFFVQIEWLAIFFEIFTGSWLYGLAGGSCVTEIGIESCRKARAQFYDGYTVNKTGKCQISWIFAISSITSPIRNVFEM